MALAHDDTNPQTRLARLRRLRQLKEAAGEATPVWSPLPHQIAPAGDWDLWLLMGGRGSGKTDASAYYVQKHIEGPPCIPGPEPHRIGIVAPTLGDARVACVEGPSGLKAHSAYNVHFSRGLSELTWPNGSSAKLFGALNQEDVERLRAGGNRCLVWVEELAAWRKIEEAWDNMELGLRLGPHPRVIGSTTPRTRRYLRKLINDPTTAITRATTRDNPHLSPKFRKKIERMYAGTRLERQEINGEMLEDVIGALFNEDQLIEDRTPSHPDLERIVVAVDPTVEPPGPDTDEAGIVTVGRGIDQHGYVLEDNSGRMAPVHWARAAVAAYHRHNADAVVAEVNNGGELVANQIRAEDPTVKVITVRASRGKVKRAEPIAGLYDRHLVHHVGTLGPGGVWVFAEMESQMLGLTSQGPTTDHDDRVDAVVWGLTELLLEEQGSWKVL